MSFATALENRAKGSRLARGGAIVGRDRLELERKVERIAKRVPEVWPLQDYVALNPWDGLAGHSYYDARQWLRMISDAEMMPSWSQCRHQFAAGCITRQALVMAVDELADSAERRAEWLATIERWDAAGELEEMREAEDERRWFSNAELVDVARGTDWLEVVREEIGKHLARHYDRGQAAWRNPWSDRELFGSWKAAAQLDRRPQLLGLRGFCELVRKLPESGLETIQLIAEWEGVPERALENWLQTQAMSVMGWAAWTRYQRQHGDDEAASRQRGSDAFTSFLAMRVVYDHAVGAWASYRADWGALLTESPADADERGWAEGDWREDKRVWPRVLLMRAAETERHQEILRLLDKRERGGSERGAVAETVPLTSETERTVSKVPTAQMAFCIDVRSERYRRHLEAYGGELETIGCAGFFGLPIEFQRLGDEHAVAQLPALLPPQFSIQEGAVGEAADGGDAQIEQTRRHDKSWAGCWKRLRVSALGSFAAVETTGLGFAAKMLAANLGLASRLGGNVSDGASRDATGPSLRGLNEQGLTTTKQVELAAGVLKQLGLGSEGAGLRVAPLVVLCGHESETRNNPTASALQCGACGGHGGEVNARFLALLLNQKYVRHGLAERGMAIPENTLFVAAVHNTTTDEIVFFETESIRGEAATALAGLRRACRLASAAARRERGPALGESTREAVREAVLTEAGTSVRGLRSPLERRGRDWSEVRPEWGLTGNQAFVIGPRHLTRGKDLGGRVFLHCYDAEQDSDGTLLAQIFGGPLVVTHMINMQYNASTVDPERYGCGNKNIHNVVGQFGLLAGAGGDLRIGLPWQSVHDGERERHEPLRLHAYVAADAERIERVLAEHPQLRQWVANDWLYVYAVDASAGQMLRRCRVELAAGSPRA